MFPIIDKQRTRCYTAVSGENICIDGGMTKQMIYHGEHGWNYEG